MRAEGRARQFDRHLAILQREKEILSRGNKVELLVDGPATFAAMFAELEKARHRILLESYIIEADEIGLRLRDTLLRKRAEGSRCTLSAMPSARSRHHGNTSRACARAA